jgi:hypothetical protein
MTEVRMSTGPTMASPEPAGSGEVRQATTTLEGWRAFVDAAPARFDLLPEGRWRALAGAGRLAYDEARMSYHSQMLVAETAVVRKVAGQGRRLMAANRRDPDARSAMVVSGPPATGKSTAIKQFGRAHELRVRELHPEGERIPVVYVTTPPKDSPAMLAAQFAWFLGLGPVKPSKDVTGVAGAVCQILARAHCDIVLVDEVHNLDGATVRDRELASSLRYFTEHVPATFVYAGVNVRAGALPAGDGVTVGTPPIPPGGEWHSLVAALEGALRLHRHEPGSLSRHAGYLHARTGGVIGSLCHLVRAAAVTAILDGGEKIDQALLQQTRIDYSAEASAPA